MEPVIEDNNHDKFSSVKIQKNVEQNQIYIHRIYLSFPGKPLSANLHRAQSSFAIHRLENFGTPSVTLFMRWHNQEVTRVFPLFFSSLKIVQHLFQKSLIEL